MKKRIALLFGGKSAEHDVSVLSAKAIYNNIDKNLYEVSLIGIDMDGKTFLFTEEEFVNEKNEGFKTAKELKISEFTDYLIHEIDVVFPALHGPYGEDGKLQGYLDFINVKYVGCNHVTSAICMDKAYNKYVLQDNGFNVIPFDVVLEHEYTANPDKVIDNLVNKLGKALFVKPANMGSSVGVSKVKDKKELKDAINFAFQYDTVLVIEKALNVAEFECGIFGVNQLVSTEVGEIKPSHEFYDYEAKYSEKAVSTIEIPANLSAEDTKYIQDETLRASKLFRVSGLSRIDFLMDKDTGTIYLSEINTMPGFTQFSMYPSLAGTIGIEYQELITKLIELALE